MENNIITKYNGMPPARAAVLLALETQPQQYFNSLATSTPISMIKADSPCLWEIRRLMGEVKTKAMVIYALVWLSDLVNVERNLTEVQIGEIANDVIEEYGYLKPEEVKYILKQSVRENKIFGRLDYAVVMKWFEEYDKKRTEHCIDISNQEETQRANQATANPEAVSFDEFVAWLRQKAEDGDEDAKDQLADIDKLWRQPKILTPEEKHQKDLEFFKWKNFVYKRK